MTKRSAMTMAAGLATCLVLGVVTIMLMAGGVSIANAGAENKPLVRREVKTITVHRKAKSSSSGGVVRVIHLSSSSTDPTSESSSHENEMENENENEGVEQEGNHDGSSQQQGDNQQGDNHQAVGRRGTSGDD